jgi:hypothetical protein
MSRRSRQERGLKDGRRDRLAAALRANLKRRKEARSGTAGANEDRGSGIGRDADLDADLAESTPRGAKGI